MSPRWTLATAFGLVLLGASAVARAHTLGISTGEYTARGASLQAKLGFARADVIALVPSIDADGDGHLSAREVPAVQTTLRSKILDRVHVTRGGRSCQAVFLDAGLTEQDGFLVDGRFDCDGYGPFEVELALLDDLSPRHRHIARAVGEATHDQVLTRSERKFIVAPPLAGAVGKDTAEASGSDHEAPNSILGFVRMGNEHIVSGYDHLAFLLALVLVRARFRALVGIVTAFTIAHSLTLALAALNVFAPSPRWIEPLIALSIAYIGIENFFVRDVRKRWRVAFGFGLVHGFGFAGALREAALTRDAIPKALVSFNVGVEIGQLAIMTAALLLLGGIRRRFPEREGGLVRLVSAGLALAGVCLFVVRVAGWPAR